MQLYRHTVAPHYGSLATVPENRVYLSPDRADAFIDSSVAFPHGRVTSDSLQAPGVEIGRPGEHYRRIRISSCFGAMVVLVSDGHPAYPFGQDTTGYKVADLDATLAKATAIDAKVLVPPYPANGRIAAIVCFPGGYIAKIHVDRST